MEIQAIVHQHNDKLGPHFPPIPLTPLSENPNFSPPSSLNPSPATTSFYPKKNRQAATRATATATTLSLKP
ncbi:hypothetical protein SCA6_005326 [Theobroma cacao]